MLTVFYGLIAARRVNILRRESCRVSCGRIHPCFMIAPKNAPPESKRRCRRRSGTNPILSSERENDVFGLKS